MSTLRKPKQHPSGTGMYSEVRNSRSDLPENSTVTEKPVLASSRAKFIKAALDVTREFTRPCSAADTPIAGWEASSGPLLPPLREGQSSPGLRGDAEAAPDAGVREGLTPWNRSSPEINLSVPALPTPLLGVNSDI